MSSIQQRENSLGASTSGTGSRDDASARSRSDSQYYNEYDTDVTAASTRSSKEDNNNDDSLPLVRVLIQHGVPVPTMTGSNRKRKCRDWEYLCDLDDDARQESVEVDISVVIQDEEDSKRPRNWVVASALQGGLDSDEHEFAVEIEKAKLERIDEEAYWRRHGDPDAPYSPTRRSSTSSLSSPSIDADAGADDEDDVENVSAYSPGYSASDWSYSSHDDTIVRVCYAALKRERDLENWSESTFNDACINLLNEYYSREDDKHRLFKASRNVESQLRVISNRTNEALS